MVRLVIWDAIAPFMMSLKCYYRRQNKMFVCSIEVIAHKAFLSFMPCYYRQLQASSGLWSEMQWSARRNLKKWPLSCHIFRNAFRWTTIFVIWVKIRWIMFSWQTTQNKMSRRPPYQIMKGVKSDNLMPPSSTNTTIFFDLPGNMAIIRLYKSITSFLRT